MHRCAVSSVRCGLIMAIRLIFRGWLNFEDKVKVKVIKAANTLINRSDWGCCHSNYDVDVELNMSAFRARS